jgi:hypothetical protein
MLEHMFDNANDAGVVDAITFGPVPSAFLREVAGVAKIKPLVVPPAGAESGYRPSAALAEFVRFRDLTCRFPGCDQPADVCGHRPHRAVPARPHPCVQPQTALPVSVPTEALKSDPRHAQTNHSARKSE